MDVNTLDGKGNIYTTTITHHNNDYVSKECQGKHIITPTQKDITNIIYTQTKQVLYRMILSLYLKINVKKII